MAKIVDDLLDKLDQLKRKVMTDKEEVVDGNLKESPVTTEEKVEVTASEVKEAAPASVKEKRKSPGRPRKPRPRPKPRPAEPIAAP